MILFRWSNPNSTANHAKYANNNSKNPFAYLVYFAVHPISHCRSVLRRPPARDVLLHLLDGRVLRGDDPVHEVADRHDAANLRAVDDGQMSHAFLRHQPQPIL